VFPDSGTVVRWSLGGEVTTVATLRFPPVVSTMRQVGTRTNMVLRSNAFDFSDTPIVALTGSVQVLRGEPYRLDRIQSGTVVRGPDLPGARLEISPRDLEEFRVRADGEYPWRMKAAVREGTAILQNDSIVWAARHGPAGAATVSWDLLSTSGVRIGTRTLPAAYRVAGFAPDGEVYVWRRDADDLQWLERLVPQRP
jgi:hypothetical protein